MTDYLAVSETAHLLVVGRLRRDRARLVEESSTKELLLPVVVAHRRLRGPYTAVGTVFRALVPDALRRFPELVARHQIELLSIAPELKDLELHSTETLTSLAIPEERTRFYSRLRTQRMSHALCEFLRDYLVLAGLTGRALYFEHVAEADPTDQEFLATILRRIPPDILTILLGVTTAFEARMIPTADLPVFPPADPMTDPVRGLSYALTRYCTRMTADDPTGQATAGTPSPAPKTMLELAAEFVWSDGTSDEPELIDAYRALAEDRRRQLHDERRLQLLASGEFSHSLGAIPYHAICGTDPDETGIAALAHGRDYCMDMGFYDASVAFSELGRERVDRTARTSDWWRFTNRMVGCLAILGRGEEAEEVCDEARAFSMDPVVHMECAYMTAMLYTRHLEPSRRDHHRALGWINEAIALASLLPDHRKHTFSVVFHWNGKALIEVHCGRPAEALRLVIEGLAKLDRDLPPGDHRLHRSVLVHNRAQVLSALGRHSEALELLRQVVAADPNYPEYHFDLGNLLHRLGMEAESIAEFDKATTLGPPFPELYYNRAEVKAAVGDFEGAMADWSYVLELDPSYLDAYLNRAAILCDAEEFDRASADVEIGLLLDPANAYLLCMRGALFAAAGRFNEAIAAMSAAIDSDPQLAQSWAQRGLLHSEVGDIDAAIADLSQAVALSNDPTHRFNRANCLLRAERVDEARADLMVYLRADPAHRADVHELMPELVAS